tara:strand:- start:785 stop:1030 length:246 start_codon:yes stop_codon:yes gene_type:complete
MEQFQLEAFPLMSLANKQSQEHNTQEDTMLNQIARFFGYLCLVIITICIVDVWLDSRDADKQEQADRDAAINFLDTYNSRN